MAQWIETAALALVMALGALPAAASGVESFVEAGPAGVLKGTMLTPASAARPPVVLIVPGSGPTDRDGNNPMGVKAAPYRLLAEALAERGVATVRIDKRGMFASAGTGDGNKATFAEYGADVHSWARSIRARTGAPCVWAAGHSEGALHVLVAAQDPADLCGLILLSGAGRNIADILKGQLAAAPGMGPYLAATDAAIDKLKAGEHPDASALPAPLQALFAPQIQDFLIDEMTYDPPTLLRAYRGPVLVLRGDTDLQVSAQDADLLAHARPGIVAVSLPGVNHVLKAAPVDRAANIATYADPSLPLAPGVADAIADFVKRP